MSEGVESLRAGCGLYNAQVFNTTFFLDGSSQTWKILPKGYTAFLQIKI